MPSLPPPYQHYHLKYHSCLKPKKPPLSLPSSSSSQRKTSLSSSSQRKTSSSSSSARTMIVNTINNLFNNLMMINSNYKLQPSLDPKRALSNNFAPVDELPPTQCQVIQGSLPSCLDGAYIRNGPNQQ